MCTIVAHNTLHALDSLASQTHKNESYLTEATSDPYPTEAKGEDGWLNIFVHGIISAAPVLSFETMYHIKTDNISNTLYEYYVQNARGNCFFHKNQTMQTIGLHKIDTCRTDANDGCPATAKLFDMQYGWLDPQQNSKNYYYTYGWSGLINKKRMYNDAKMFCEQYSQEIKKFHAQGIYPKTRLIGFSHGGSVCLQVGAVTQKNNIKTNFAIDELVLLGMPIMQDTDIWTHAPIFKNIYSFYSGSDRVQVLDFSHPKKLFSRRKFKNRNGFTVPNSLTQVRLEIFRAIPYKSGWGFFKTPRKKHGNLSRHSTSLRKCSPGHCEWWFFGWTNKYYRHNFALAPLSVLSVIPTIISKLEKSPVKPLKSDKFGKQITVQLKPFEESITIINKNKKEKTTFLANNQFDQLKNTVYQHPFTQITAKRYSKEVDKEIKKAKIKLAKYNKKHPKTKKQRKHRALKTHQKQIFKNFQNTLS